MHLAWDGDHPEHARRLQRGDPVQVCLRLSETAMEQEFPLQAIVARVFEGGVGVTFRPLALEAFERLLAQRNAYRTEAPLAATESNRGSASSPSGSRRISRIEAQCKELVDPWLGLAVKAFFDQAPDRLFVCARDAGNDVEQRDYLDAMLLLKQERSRLESEIAAAVRHENAGTPKDSRPERAGPGFRLSLVQDNELEHLLARAELVSQAESRHKTSLYQLGLRLEALSATGQGLASLAVSPEVFSNAFSSALATLGFKPIQIGATYKVLADTLVPHLETLYGDLNELLASEGILPDLGYGHGSPGAVRRAPVEGSDHTPQVNPGAPPSGVDGSPSPAGSRAPAYADPQASVADPYRSVRDLQTIERQHQTDLAPRHDGYPGPPPISPSAAAANSTEPTVHAGEIAQLLHDFQSWGQHLAQDVRARTVKERLQSELDRRGGGTRQRRMGDREGQAIDVVTGLLNAIDEDAESGEILKPQIRRLQLPIYKTALTDPDFFSHKDHPARRALDQLARLQELLGEKDGKLREERAASIERVVARVAQDFGSNEDVFADAVRELDGLLAWAEREYADNVARLVGECEREQALRAGCGEDESGSAPGAPNESSEAATEAAPGGKIWLDLAKRLAPGDTLLVAQASGPPTRLALAWVGERFDPYVFVDSSGRRAAALSLRDLAEQLRRGLMVKAKSAEIPIVDRAFYAVAQQIHRQIGQQASHDPATGLQNRKGFLCALAEALAHRRDRGLQPALLYLQVDGFAPLADRYGAAATTLFLKRFAAFLQQRLHRRAELAYVGDLAFAVLLQSSGNGSARTTAAQLLRAITTSTVRCHSERFQIGASLGLLFPLRDSADPEALLEAALLASQAARENGGNCIHESSPGSSPARASIDWGAWLERCRSGDEIELFCKRVVPLKEGAGTLPQVELLPGLWFQDRICIAPEGVEGSDESREPSAVDRRVIAQALRWMARHPDRIERYAGCTVKLSAAGLRDEHLLDYVLEELVESPTPPGKVCFEITEAALAKHYAEAQRFVRTLNEFGCRFTLSGFGRTEAGREHLSKLRMDFLKIDRLFVGDFDSNPKDYALVKSANEIGHLLGMQTIAADIEIETGIGQLKEIGFDYAEGPAIAPLQPLAELA